VHLLSDLAADESSRTSVDVGGREALDPWLARKAGPPPLETEEFTPLTPSATIQRRKHFAETWFILPVSFLMKWALGN
jgi:hypothetical protein